MSDISLPLPVTLNFFFFCCIVCVLEMLAEADLLSCLPLVGAVQFIHVCLRCSVAAKKIYIYSPCNSSSQLNGIIVNVKLFQPTFSYLKTAREIKRACVFTFVWRSEATLSVIPQCHTYFVSEAGSPTDLNLYQVVQAGMVGIKNL